MILFSEFYNQSHLPCKTPNPSSGVGKVSVRDRHHKTLLSTLFPEEDHPSKLVENGWTGYYYTLSHFFALCPFVICNLSFPNKRRSRLGRRPVRVTTTTMQAAAFHLNPFPLISQTPHPLNLSVCQTRWRYVFAQVHQVCLLIRLVLRCKVLCKSCTP